MSGNRLQWRETLFLFDQFSLICCVSWRIDFQLLTIKIRSEIDPSRDSYWIECRWKWMVLSFFSRWRTDRCNLIRSNTTHSVCSCRDSSTFAIQINQVNVQRWEKVLFNVTRDDSDGNRSSISCCTWNRRHYLNRLSVIDVDHCHSHQVNRCERSIRINRFYSLRRHINIDDDLLSIRNFLHIHLSFCLLIVEIFYLVSVERFLAKVKRTTRFLISFAFSFCF